MRESGNGTFRRGFSQRNDAGEVEWVGVELELIVLQALSSVARHFADLGAPPDTVMDVETEKATVQLTLVEATGK